MEETYEQLMEAIDSIKAEKEKWFDKQTKAAGKRMRKSALDVKKLAVTLRQEISEEIRSL